jgi:hypothetical protein
VSEFTVKLLDPSAPNNTVDAPVKPEPVMVTTEPPAELPLDGLIAEMLGAELAATPNRSAVARLDMPPGPTAVISIPPATIGGIMAVTLVSELIVNDGLLIPPKRTSVSPVNPVPVSVTWVPQSVSATTGEIEVIPGAGGTL